MAIKLLIILGLTLVVGEVTTFATPNADHFYTTDLGESNNAYNRLAYQPQGSCCSVWSSPVGGAQPLYRLFQPASGDHFYTMSLSERTQAINGGYRDEGICCYVQGPPKEKELYRLLHPKTNDHFYTASLDERDRAVSQGYQNEGVCCFVFREQVPNSVPLYRLFNGTSHDHFYTATAQEKDGAIASQGYSDEGICCYLPQTGIPLHRLWNGTVHDHFYTTSVAERDNAIAQVGYRDEGICCHVTVPSTDRIALWRLYNPADGDHFYTTSQDERDRYISQRNYRSEGICCYVPTTRGPDVVTLWRSYHYSETEFHKHLSIRRFLTTPLSDDEADQFLSHMSVALERQDGAEDAPCPVRYFRAGPVGTFSGGTGTINSRRELDAVLNENGYVKAVNAINYCGGLGTNIIGCAKGLSFIVTRQSQNTENGALWAHEYGHTKDLEHDDRGGRIMHSWLNTGGVISASDCTAYKKIIVLGGPRFPIPLQTIQVRDGRAKTNVVDFVHGRYFSGFPVDLAEEYGPQNVPTLLAMLQDPLEGPYWPNIIALLGYIGDERAIDPLIRFLEGDIEDDENKTLYRAKLSVLHALGYLVGKSGNPVAIDYLLNGINLSQWQQTKINILKSGGLALEQSAMELVKQSIIGLALSGDAKAGEALRTLADAKSQLMVQYREDFESLLEVALPAHAQIAKEGLKAYMSSANKDQNK